MNITTCCVASSDAAYVAMAILLGSNTSYRHELSSLIQRRSSVLYDSDPATVADVMNDWDQCLHTILAMPPPPSNRSQYNTPVNRLGFRLQVAGHPSVEVVLRSNDEEPAAVAAAVAASHKLEPLHQYYIQTLLFNGLQRWRQQSPRVAISADVFPGMTPPVDVYVGDDVALAVHVHLWRYKYHVSGTELGHVIASIRSALNHADESTLWIAARGAQYPPPPPTPPLRSFIAPLVSHQTCVTVVVTTCKRLSLFLATMHSFLPYAATSSVCMLLVLDDHSSAADRRVMQDTFPAVEFVFTRRKGHAHSLNTMLELVTTRFMLYLEDDWRWELSLPHHPLAHALAILEHDPTIVQVLVNTQRSGWPRRLPTTDDTSFGLYFRHEYGVVDHAFGYWPGFSLNPGVWDLKRLSRCPALRFNESSDVFEREFSLAVWRCGLHVAMLPYTTAVHIGTNGSAYVLNGLPRRFD
ncbi:hypothetical protein DYB34_011823 [Aphanomyces astaci]|uniref:Glycosyltransferase 2-like domain-containing protein n=1 Tax=Aphanomyces astaci TaxID=112090 RepID=A0A418BSJ8_APHAT|nr:hypothetical protein DYB34_011823 [Aphanomyces astaci]